MVNRLHMFLRKKRDKVSGYGVRQLKVEFESFHPTASTSSGVRFFTRRRHHLLHHIRASKI